MLLSTFVSPAYAAGALVPAGFGALVSGLTYSGSLSTIASAGVGALFGSAVNWASGGISIDASDINNSFNKTYNTNITNTGATNNYRYNNTTNVNNYQAINTTNNTYYNPITNNYNTYNDISYNSTYNTYKITNNNYNSYVTNNNTYVSYYVIDMKTETEYYYEVYYRLPDGRNSYDLQAEDVWGTYFMYNAINYREVIEDDGKTLALWHLDGDVKNSAAVGYGDLDTPSLNFVETPFVGGLDTGNRSTRYFTVPFSSDVKTIEFRVKVNNPYYASSSSGKLIYLNEATLPVGFSKYGSSNSKMVFSCDEWTTVCLQRNGSSWDYFCNGKYVSTGSIGKESNSLYFTNYIDGGYGTYGLAFTTCVYDEIRLSNNVLYTGDYAPRTQPFDTNKVLVVPDSAGMTDTTIAVKSSVPVGALRVGGVRPTYPGNGDVYVVEENGIVKDVQQYQSDGWYSVTASLYINGEWKLFVGFDISGFELNKPDSPGGGTGPGGSGDSGGSGSGGGSSGFWDKLLQSVFGGVLSVLASLLSGLLTLLSTILTMLLGLVGYIGIFLPFLPSGVVTLICGGVFIVLALIVVKFIGNLL